MHSKGFSWSSEGSRTRWKPGESSQAGRRSEIEIYSSVGWNSFRSSASTGSASRRQSADRWTTRTCASLPNFLINYTTWYNRERKNCLGGRYFLWKSDPLASRIAQTEAKAKWVTQIGFENWKTVKVLWDSNVKRINVIKDWNLISFYRTFIQFSETIESFFFCFQLNFEFKFNFYCLIIIIRMELSMQWQKITLKHKKLLKKSFEIFWKYSSAFNFPTLRKRF